MGYDLILLGSDLFYNMALCRLAQGYEKGGLVFLENARKAASLLGADQDLRFLDRAKELKLKAPLELFPYESQECIWGYPLDPVKRNQMRRIQVHGKYARRDVFVKSYKVPRKCTGSTLPEDARECLRKIPKQRSVTNLHEDLPEGISNLQLSAADLKEDKLDQGLRKSLSSPNLGDELGNIVKDCISATHKSLERMKKKVMASDFEDSAPCAKPKDRTISRFVKVQNSNLRSINEDPRNDSSQIEDDILPQEQFDGSHRIIPRKPVLTIETDMNKDLIPSVTNSSASLLANPRRQSRLLIVNKVKGANSATEPDKEELENLSPKINGPTASDEFERKPVYSFIKKDPFGATITPRGNSLSGRRNKPLPSPILPEKPTLIDERQSSFNLPKKNSSMADIRSSFLENRGLIPNFVRIQTASTKFCRTETVAVPVDITLEALSTILFTVDYRKLLIFYTTGGEPAQRLIKTDDDLSEAIMSAAGHAGVLTISAEINPLL